ncbi:transcription factor GTE4-like [Impatiens glandulifera]|uniref:transcription factor GTE4-like n=1 Tax=Impatiens glandulifera TaxID=253017 RepID=UPI001FB12930|nr:transcription factor GTE4-like [Impatiens glandulifera]
MMAFPRQESHVTISLSLRSKKEKRELRRKLQSELDLVRNWVKKIEWKDSKLNSVLDSLGAKSTNSEVASLDHPSESKTSRPLQQGFSDNTGKEKRTKGNLLYRNSESKKKLKTNAHEAGSGKFSNHTLKNCVTLLDRLMKHKHGWVFNEPVDPKNLGLSDYFDIIKFPMDLSTVKTRLNTNWYKSPREFAEDVRLTFNNALTYNPKGQDVHLMAVQLSELFENKWAVIEADYKRELMLAAVDSESKSRTAPPLQSPLPEMTRTLERSESTTDLIDPKSNLKNLNMKPATKKSSKTKFMNKRDMTYEEKEKLSTNLQNLPSEKLDNVVQIIKRRAPSLCHNDDEIEVDIDSVDAETLWELERFVNNYQKSLSKNKRKDVHYIQSTEETEQNAHKMVPPVILVEESEVAKLGHEEKQREKVCRLSSSSSESESSSSDSDRQSSPG